MKYKESDKAQLIESVANEIETTDKRIIDICNDVGVHYRTLNMWIRSSDVWRKRYESAKQLRYRQQGEIVKDVLRKSLIERLEDRTVTETKTTIRYSPSDTVIDKTVTTTKRVIPASEKLICLALTESKGKTKRYKRKKLSAIKNDPSL